MSAINARTRTNVKPILACDAIWKESERKTAEAQDAYGLRTVLPLQ